MSLCNVVACANCLCGVIKPQDCPIELSLKQGISTEVVGIENMYDQDYHAAVGVSCFKSNLFEQVNFINCSCVSGIAVSKSYSLKKLRSEVNYEAISNYSKSRTEASCDNGLRNVQEASQSASA